MAVIIGSARIDENGAAHGGAAGDQTGKEVSTQNWYAHSKGWVLLRAKSAEAREKIARCMEAACKNTHVGYDQYQRDTLYNEAKRYGFDVSKITKNVETDCSALVRVCVNYAGIPVGNFRTTNETSVLMATGSFDKFTDDLHCKKSTNLLRGDILNTRSQGHTVVVLTDGSKASDEMPLTLGCRTLKKGCAGTDVRELQEKLVSLGFSVGSCGIDGDFGSDTQNAVKLFQNANGLEATGIYDTVTYEKLRTLSAADEPTVVPVPEEKPAGSTVEIFAENGGSVNIRCGNSTDYSRISTAKSGETYDFVATAANGWNAVIVGKQVGWVSGKYSKVI